MDPSYQPPHHYMRPPPAPPSLGQDPNYPPPPHQNSWYPGQFQYHPTHSPSPPPPPQHNHWGPPPPPPPPQPHPYPAHPHQAYPAPPPQQYPPPPPPHYPNQDLGSANWTHHPGYEYPGAQGNNEDWAAKARAWASRSAIENQQSQSQYTSATWQEDPSHYANQYPQPVESNYQDVQQTSTPTSGYSNYQGPAVPLHRPLVVSHQEPAPVSSYSLDSHIPYTTQDGALGQDMNATYAHHQAPKNYLIHQQEVPSSNSSIPGNEGGLRGRHANSSLLVDSGSLPVDHAQFAYGSQPVDPMDRPLNFAPRFSHENDPNISASYPVSSGRTDSVTDVSSLHSWTAPVAPGAPYPPIAPVFSSASQHYPASMPPIPGQLPPLYGTGPGFQPPVPSITTAGLSAVTALHAAAFPEDAYGVPLGSERPKKAAVPNWLREEIIKTKATIVTSGPEHLKDESQSIEDDLIDKPIEKGDQADSKSTGSARSTEEEDDEEKEDAERTAAINQEIKRVLTEVLLKVTDELFDEIAAKVLIEDDLTAPKISPRRPPVPAPKASAKFPIPVQAKKSEDHLSEDSSSGAPGNILGLANYASDEDDDKQVSSASKPDARVAHGASENGGLQIGVEEQKNSGAHHEVCHSNGRSTGTRTDQGVLVSKLDDHSINKDLDNSNGSRTYSINADATYKKGNDKIGDATKSADNGYNETFDRPDTPSEKHNVRRSSRDDSQEREAKGHEKHESKKSSSGRDKSKDTESSRDEKLEKIDKTEDSKRERERYKKEKSPHHGEKARESESRKRFPHHEGKDSKLDRDRDIKRSNKGDMDKRRSSRDVGDKKSSKEDGDRKRSSKEDGDRKRSSKEAGDKQRERKEEKSDKPRQMSSDAGRHKRRRSLSVGSQDKPSRGCPHLSDGSSDDASGDSKRMSRSKRRNSSPSPTRSRRRQVSRSPHSKHTQRRHSPYSSLDGSRGRRSRSRSPARRHR